MKNLNYILILVLFACGEPTALAPLDTEKSDSTVFTRTSTFERDKLHRDATIVPVTGMDADQYIYDFNVDQANFTEQAPRISVQPINLDSASKKNISYVVSKDNRPPLFDQKCLQNAAPVECSNQALVAFISEIVAKHQSENIIYKRAYDMVTFIVDQDGKILGDVFIAPNNTKCQDCDKTAVEIVTKMNRWIPALRDGKPVSARVQVPVRYDR